MSATITSEADTLLTAGEEAPAGESRAWERRQLFLALAAALGLHLLPVVFVMARWALVAVGALDPGIGDPKGVPDGVNVEVIDAKEFNKRFTSHGQGQAPTSGKAGGEPPKPAATPAPPQPQTPPQQPQQQAQPVTPPAQQPAEEPQPKETAEPEPKPAPEKAERPQPQDEIVSDVPLPALRKSVMEAKPEPKPEPKPTRETPPEPPAKAAAQPAPPPQPPSQLSEEKIAELLAEARQAKAEGMAGAARSGRVSLYMRGVERKLDMATPVFRDVRGFATVFMVIADNGDLALLRIVESSGNPTIDAAVLAGIRTQRFGPPPPGSAMNERTVLVTYEYRGAP